jgi:hypothetical protein
VGPICRRLKEKEMGKVEVGHAVSWAVMGHSAQEREERGLGSFVFFKIFSKPFQTFKFKLFSKFKHFKPFFKIFKTN